MPHATPEPMVTNAKSLHPAAAPNQCSAAVMALTSFSTTAGKPVLLRIISTRVTSDQSKNGDTRTTSERGETGPAKLTPTTRMAGSPSTSSDTAVAITSVTD